MGTKIREKIRQLKCTDWLVVIVFLFSVIWSFYYMFSDYMLAKVNSDTVGGVVKLNEVIRERNLIPQNWYYANTKDIPYMVAILLAVKMVFGESLLTLQVFKVFIYLGFLLCAFVFAKKMLQLNTKYVMLFLIVLMCPFSQKYLQYMYMDGYALRLAQWMLLVLLGFKAIDGQLKIHKKWFGAFMVTQFLFMTGEVRFLAIFLAPYLIAVLWVWFSDNYQRKLATCLKEIVSVVLLVAGTIAIFIAGKIYQVIAYKDIAYASGYTNASMLNLVEGNIGEQVQKLISEILVGLGYNSVAKQMSLEGILSLAVVIFACILLVIFPVLLTRNYKTYSINIKRLIVLYWFTWLFEILTIVFSVNGLGFRHVLYTIVLGIGLSIYYVVEEVLRQGTVLSIVFGIAMSAFVVVNWITPPFAVRAEEIVDAREDLCDFLLFHDLKYGYATYWNAGVYTVWSDMEVLIYPLDKDEFEPYHWYSTRELYLPTEEAGKTFIMLSEQEYNEWSRTVDYQLAFDNYSDILRYSNYVILVYDYNVATNFDEYDKNQDIRNDLSYSEQCYVEEENVILPMQETMFGPYITLDPGHYTVTIDCQMEGQNEFIIRDFAAGENVVISTITNGTNVYEFDLLRELKNVELYLCNQTEDIIVVNQVVWEQNEEYNNNNWYCINSLMNVNEQVSVDDSITIHEGGVVFGPYWNLNAGTYELKVNAVIDAGQNPVLYITANEGATVIEEVTLQNGEIVIPFTLGISQRAIEYKIVNMESDINVDLYYRIKNQIDSNKTMNLDEIGQEEVIE